MIRMAADSEHIRVVKDQIFSPTYAADLSKAIISLLNNEASGIFHLTNQGCCSWYEFACKIFELMGVKADIEPILTRQYPTLARRPGYSVLDNNKFANLGLDLLPPWQEALETYLKYRTC